MAKKGVVDLQKAVNQILSEYEVEARTVLNTTIPKAAKIARDMIADNSKKDTGAYAKDWKVKSERINRLGSVSIVYNAQHYRLTHLLENDHAIKGGGRHKVTVGTYKGDGVIKDAETYANAWLISETVNELERIGVKKH